LKKGIFLGMCIVLSLFAAACTKGPEVDELAESPASAGEEIQAEDAPTLPPDEEIVDAVAPASYRYEPLSLADGGLTMDYPAHWTRIPGTHTVCFVEPEAGEGLPARVTLTRKALSKAPDANKKTSHLAAFVKRMVQDFDSYEVSPLGTDGSFLGDKAAYWVTYTVQKEGVSLKGYVIMAAREKALFVYHFRTNITDYEAFQPVMIRVRDSVSIK
jgi:hypothetical protein